MAFINLLQAVYPVGAVYISTVNTSPSSLIGGTWTKVEGACLAAQGDGYASVANYGGSLTISIEQMPAHHHSLSVDTWGSGFGGQAVAISKDPADYIATGSISDTGGGQNYYPYHFSIYVWYRTA